MRLDLNPFRATKDPYQTAVGVIVALAALLRCGGIAMAWSNPVLQDWLVAQCVTALALEALALSYLRRGNISHAALLIGFDYVALATVEMAIGIFSNLAYLVLIHPLLTMIMRDRSIGSKLFLAVSPLITVAALRYLIATPQISGVVSEKGLLAINAGVLLTVATAIVALSLAFVEHEKRVAREARIVADARKRVIDDMSHEMRTPLAVQLAAVQSLDDFDNNDALRDALQTMEGQSRLLGLMVDQMLHMASQEGEHDVIPILEDDLIAATRLIVEELRPLSDQRGVRISLDLDEDVRHCTDAVIYRFALANLLTNAIRFSPAGGMVVVSLRAATNEVRVQVRDQGPGLDEDSLHRVFERFWKGDASRSRAGGHLGLGLAVAKANAVRLGATISVANAAGGGALFAISWTVDGSGLDAA